MYFDCGGKVNHFFRCKNHTFTVFPPSLQIMTKKTAIHPSERKEIRDEMLEIGGRHLKPILIRNSLLSLIKKQAKFILLKFRNATSPNDRFGVKQLLQ